MSLIGVCILLMAVAMPVDACVQAVEDTAVGYSNFNFAEEKEAEIANIFSAMPTKWLKQ